MRQRIPLSVRLELANLLTETTGWNVYYAHEGGQIRRVVNELKIRQEVFNLVSTVELAIYVSFGCSIPQRVRRISDRPEYELGYPLCEIRSQNLATEHCTALIIASEDIVCRGETDTHGGYQYH